MAVRKNSDLVVSYLTLRQMIGAIGLLMPIVVRLVPGSLRNHDDGVDQRLYYYRHA
jgi:hypothetical protein